MINREEKFTSREFFIFQKEEESLTISSLQAKISHTEHAKVTYKLGTDVNNRILVKLTDFLKLPSVIEAGTTLKSSKFITPAPLHEVANVELKSGW